MSSDIGFRSQEEEVLKLLTECGELRNTLRSISLQIGRMETRVRKSFPAVVEKERARKEDQQNQTNPSISADQALREFDRIVRLVADGASEEAEKVVQQIPAPDLTLIAKEVGISFPKNKSSLKAIREGVFGKVRESVLLTRHSARS